MGAVAMTVAQAGADFKQPHLAWSFTKVPGLQLPSQD